MLDMIETNKLYNECCLKTMERMPDKFIDLSLTSPPYNMRTRIRNGKYTTREKSEHFSKKYEHFDDALSIDEYYDFHKKVLHELLRVSNIVLWNFAVVTGSKEAIFKLIGDFNKSIKDIIIWDKGHGQPAMHNGCINRASELILVLEGQENAGRTLNHYNFNRGEMDDIWHIKRQRSSNKEHGAVWPGELVEKAVLNFSKEGSIVYDPFTGTGTTTKIASLNNRKYIGSEIVKEYYEIARDNIKSDE